MAVRRCLVVLSLCFVAACGSADAPLGAPANSSVEAGQAGRRTIGIFDMSHSAGGNNNDGTWNIWSEGVAEAMVDFDVSGTYTIGADAYGSYAGGDWPNLQIQLDGVQQGNAAVRTATLSHFSFAVAATAGTHKVGVAFTNDYWDGVNDRNLYVADITVDPPTSDHSGSGGSAPGIPGGTHIFVATNGHDDRGDGSYGNPYGSLSHAATVAPADSGVTIILAPGTYDEWSAVILPIGVNIWAQGPSTTTVRSGISDWLIHVQSPPVARGNQTIQGFAIDGKNRALAHGIVVQGRNDVRITNMAFTDIYDRGIAVDANVYTDETTAPTAWVSGIEIDHCTFLRTGVDHGDWADGNLVVAQADGAYIHDNSVTDGPGGGYGIRSAWGWLRHTRYSHNTTRISGRTAAWGSNPGIEVWNLSNDCELDNNDVDTWVSLVHGNRGNGSSSVRVHDNVINASASSDRREALELAHNLSDIEVDHNTIVGSSMGIAIWGTNNESQTNISIHHNVLSGMFDPRGWQSGIEIHPEPGAVFSNFRIDDNVFNSTQTMQWGVVGIKAVDPGTISNFQVRNNVFMNAVGDFNESIFSSSGTTVQNVVFNDNLLFNVHTGASTAAYQGIIQGDPRLDGSFHPISGSPVVDRGVDVGYPYRGGAPDLGAFEQ